jgi:hypothetical protein
VHTGFWWGNLKEGDQLGDTGVDGKVILKWIFKKSDGDMGLDLSGLGYGEVAGCCDCGNEPSSSVK